MTNDHPSQKYAVRIRQGGQEKIVPLNGQDFIIGREPSLPVCISSITVSRRHLLVRISSGKVHIRDLGSSNGTFVNGKRLPSNEDFTLFSTSDEFFLGNVISIAVIPMPVQELGSQSEIPALSSDILEATGLGAGAIPGATNGFGIEAPSAQNFTAGQAPQAAPATAANVASAERSYIQLTRETSRPAHTAFPSAHETLQELRAKAMAEIEAKQEEAARFCDSLREESRREAQSTLEKAEKARREIDDQKTRLEAEVNLRIAKTKELAQEQFELDRKVATLRGQLQEIESRHATLGREAADFAVQKKELEKTIQAETERHGKLVQETEAHQATSNRLVEEIGESQQTITELRKTVDEFRDALKREQDLLEFETKKNKAQMEIVEAEMRTRRLSMEASLAEMEARKNTSQREIDEDQRKLAKQREEFARVHEELESDQKAARDLAAKIEADKNLADQLRIGIADNQIAMKTLTYEREKAAEATRAAIQEQERMVGEAADLRGKVEALETKRQDLVRSLSFSADQLKSMENDAKKVQERMEQDKLDSEKSQAKVAELRTIIAGLDESFLKAKTQTEKAESTFTELKKKQEADLAAMRAAEEKKLAGEIAAKREASQAEYREKMRALELEFAEARRVEGDRLNQMKAQAQAEEASRKKFVLDEIMGSIQSVSQQGSLEQMLPQLRSSIKDALEGKSVSTLSAKAAERTKKFWKKVGISIAVPAGVALFFALFPQTPNLVRHQFLRTVASENKESGGVFLQEIRNRGVKYQPPMDRNFRDSYSDNILYLEDYTQMKSDAAAQKDWTLLLNDFIVGRLGLSDRVLPDFMAAEAVMVKDLTEVRENILPQFKDQGLARMQETEKTDLARIQNLLQTEDNYKKLRNFEKSFYANYMDRKLASVPNTPGAPAPASTSTASK